MQGLLWHDVERKVAAVSFRGTKDAVDVITDLKFLRTPFVPLDSESKPESANLGKNGVGMEVHGGFYAAFVSLEPQLAPLLAALPADTAVIFTGRNCKRSRYSSVASSYCPSASSSFQFSL